MISSETSKDDIVTEVQHRKRKIKINKREESVDEEDTQGTSIPDSKETFKITSALQSYLDVQENIREESFLLY